MTRRAFLLWATLVGWSACTCGEGPPSATKTPPPALRPVATIAAFGDVHGDLTAARAALRLVGAIDERDTWIGGALRVVQTGDHLDRGDDDRAVFELFARLRSEATRAGGAFAFLLGNHELLNAKGELRYATDTANVAYVDLPGLDATQPRLLPFPAALRPRAAAYLPGGPIAQQLAHSPVILLQDGTVFAHGGVLPPVARTGLAAVNAQARAYLLGQSTDLSLLDDPDGPVWTRALGGPATEVDCALVEQTLAITSAKRMVVGHTVQQQGITSACGGTLWRIDVGMSRAVAGGAPMALRIQGDDVRVLGP